MDDDIDNYESVQEEISVDDTDLFKSSQSEECSPKQIFEEYDSKPFSFATGVCDEETEEEIFQAFKNWVTKNNEDFLYTFEPRPTLKHLSLGKCPYLHTGQTLDECLELLRLKEKQARIKKRVEEFLKKRFRLISRLIAVYKKTKKGIEIEYMKDLSKNDPYCEFKKKEATKKIVDMMIKQFALEYLYLQVIKIRSELDEINCILLETDRTLRLKLMHKYTVSTAEKLRCLLEMQCNDEPPKLEIFFEDKTLRDMARMYLNQIENVITSVKSPYSEKWSDQEWEETWPELLPEYECMSDLFLEDNSLNEEVDGGTSEITQGSSGLDEEKTTVRSEEAVPHEGHPTEEVKFSGDEEDDFARSPGIEEGLKEVFLGEESDNVFEQIKKEILKPDYSLTMEASIVEDDEDQADERAAKLELNMKEVELLEEFKRELWIMEAFYFFTACIRPELFGKFKLIHDIPDDDNDIEIVGEEESATSDETVSSDLNKCLVYLNRFKKAKEDENGKNLNSLPLFESTVNPETKTPAVVDLYKKPDYDSPEHTNIADVEPEIAFIPSSESSEIEKEPDDVLSDTCFNPSFKVETQHFEKTDDLERNDTENISNGTKGGSIPSFAGSLYDPWKKYRKCAEKRRLPDGDSEPMPLEGAFEEEEKDDFETESLYKMVASSFHSEVKSNISLYILGESSPGEERDSEKNEITASKNICFPKLIDVLDYFTKKLKGNTSSEEMKVDIEEDVKEEEENVVPLMDWQQFTNIKWMISEGKKQNIEPLECDLDLTEIMDQLHKANTQYMRNHPEMNAIIVLILREFSLKRPNRDFIPFIREFVHNKHFAHQLTSYLTVQDKDYSRRKGLENYGKQYVNTAETWDMFNFDKPSSECWKEWGVDYEKIVKNSERYNQDAAQSSSISVDVKPVVPQPKDDWNLVEILKKIKAKRSNIKKSMDPEERIQRGWSTFSKNLKKQESKDLFKEKVCIDAISRKINWEQAQMSTTSCEKKFPPKKNNKREPPTDH